MSNSFVDELQVVLLNSKYLVYICDSNWHGTSSPARSKGSGNGFPELVPAYFFSCPKLISSLSTKKIQRESIVCLFLSNIVTLVCIDER